MERNQFILLLSKKLSKEIGEHEKEQLNRALQNEAYQKLATQIEAYFTQNETADNFSVQLDLTWEKIKEAEKTPAVFQFDFEKSKKSMYAVVWLRIAAILIVVFSVGVASYFFLKSNAPYQTLATTDQEVFKVLADGTTVWLNKQSVLTYNRDFGKQNREITLTGEAYFDVVKNAAIPLIVHAGRINIKVKGTAFNVNAYKENDHIQVSLVRGAIVVSDQKNAKNSVLLKPNEQLIFTQKFAGPAANGFQISTLKPELIYKETSWMTDTLIFNKEKLIDLALKLEKKYNLKIEIRSEKLKEKRFSGTLINETIDQAMEALKLSYPLTYTINKQLVVIKDSE